MQSLTNRYNQVGANLSTIMLLAKLKHETQAHHNRIEVDLNPMRDNLDLTGYRDLLRRFLGYYAKWERAVDVSGAPLLEGRAKCSNLIADLTFFGDSPEEISSLPLCDVLPLVDTRSRILGSMYVTEGATLGGQILRRHFAEKFSLHEQGNTFFTSYGDRTSSMWKQFGTTLETVPAKESDEAVAAAVATFESMHDWLCYPEPPEHPIT